MIDAVIPKIIYPGVIFERQESEKADNHFNCPIVQSYPDVIKNNVDDIRDGKVDYYHPYINLADEASVAKVLTKTFSDLGISEGDITKALHHGYEELAAFKKDIQDKGEETLMMLNEKGEKGIVL